LVQMTQRLVSTSLAGVCASAMRLFTSARRNPSATESIVSEARRWSMPACTAVARAVHLRDDSKDVIAALGRQWTEEALFEPLLELTARIRNELPGWLTEWFRILKEARLYEASVDHDLCVRAFGQDFSSDEVKSSAMQLLHVQWLTLCEATSTSLRERGFRDVSELVRRETGVTSWR